MLDITIKLKKPDLSADQLGLLYKFHALAGVENSTERLVRDRVLANTVNFCALSAQEAIVDRIGREYNIREKRGMGRFPSFIQAQVKMPGRGHWAEANKGSPYEVELKAAPFSEEAKANRPNAIPLILDILEEGQHRLPFIGKRLAIPTDKAREGGTFRGKVREEYKWESLGLRKNDYVRKHPRKKGEEGGAIIERIGLKGQFVRLMKNRFGKSGADAAVIQFPADRQSHEKGPDGKRHLKGGNVLYLLYEQGHPKTKVRDSLHFIKLAQETVNRVAEKHFFDLLQRNGDGRSLTGQFKYYDAVMAQLDGEK